MVNGTVATPATAFAETHSAIVVFVGDRAYKLKKPVDLGFLNFSTRQAREQACRREVELNRRLAPDVYLGVADITGPDGAMCEHLVVMRRMPDDRRLTALLQHGEVASGCVREVARQIAALHARVPTSSAGMPPDRRRNRFRAPMLSPRNLNGNANAAWNPSCSAYGANCGQRFVVTKADSATASPRRCASRHGVLSLQLLELHQPGWLVA